jgi:type II secretion system protein E
MLIGEILSEDIPLTGEQIERALEVQQDTGQKLGEVLLSLGYCSEEQALCGLAKQAGIRLVAIRESDLDPRIISLIPAELAYKHQSLPLTANDTTIRVAVADPFNVAAAEDIRIVTGLSVDMVFADPQEVRRLVEEHYMRRMIADTADEDIEILADSDDEIGDLERMAKETTVIKLVNLILRQAVQERATDVHVEPFEKGMKVRYRIDGMLHEVSSPPARLQGAIISRLKIMANLDIAQRRLPQDGRIKTKIAGSEVDVRMSTVPTLYGESIALRLLYRSAMSYRLEKVGMVSDIQRQMEKLITLPHGMILATGPTGSGKTTTLYGALQKAYSPEKKVITIEDPIEYQLDGINQIQVHPQIGLTFANGLRHIVRQDPDIIMVGEIRDWETAEIAVQSALTGHLVFSTLHTNDAAGAVTRLLDMDVEPYLVSSCVEAVVAQRLVRLICPNCKEPRSDAEEITSKFGDTLLDSGNHHTLLKGRGCDQCKHRGYRGRTGIFELLTMNDQVRALILNRAPARAIQEAACERGMRTLRQDGWAKVMQGLTTVEEVVRVTRQEDVEAAE